MFLLEIVLLVEAGCNEQEFIVDMFGQVGFDLLHELGE